MPLIPPLDYKKKERPFTAEGSLVVAENDVATGALKDDAPDDPRYEHALDADALGDERAPSCPYGAFLRRTAIQQGRIIRQ